MQYQNPNNSKRQIFRQEIRRRQIQTIFAERRKILASQPHHLQEITQFNGANNKLMKESLQKNQLLPKLSWLLPSLSKKLQDKPNINNVEFVVSISCNILKDDISIDQKQYIYKYCVEGIGAINIMDLSPIVEVYFYETVFQQCYECFDESYQVEIQEKIIPRLASLLLLQHINMKLVCQQYTHQKLQADVYEGVLNSFVYFYMPDHDHNNTLLYKVKRTTHILKTLILWTYKNLNKLQSFSNFQLLIKLIISILSNITEMPMSISLIIGQQMTIYLMQIMIAFINVNQERLQELKSRAVYSLNCIFKDQMEIISLNLNQNIFKLLTHELQNSINNCYQKSLINLFITITTQLPLNNQQQYIAKYLQYVMRTVLQILSVSQQHTQLQTLRKCLQLVHCILVRGQNQGNSSYSDYFSSLGAGKFIDGLYPKMYNQDIVKIMDDITYLVQLC